MPYDSSNPYDSVTAYDVGNPVTVSLAGIQSSEAFGLFRFSAPVTKSVSGIVSAQALSPVAASYPDFFNVTGIVSAQAFGPVSVNSAVFMSVSGIGSAEALSNLSTIAPFFFNSFGIGSGESFGTYTTAFIAPSPVLVQSVRNFSITGSTASIAFTTANITNGNTILLAAAIALPTTILSVTDTAGNIYVKSITNKDAVGGSTITIWSAPITQGAGTKPTVHILTNGTGLVYAFLWEYNGLIRLSSTDSPAVSSGDGGNGINVSSGPISTKYVNDVLVGICICGTTVTAATPGWTALAGASNPRVSGEIFLAFSPGIYSADFTQTSASIYNAALASFRSAILEPARASRIL